MISLIIMLLVLIGMLVYYIIGLKKEMEMSKYSRTRGEMKSCYEILERWNK